MSVANVDVAFIGEEVNATILQMRQSSAIACCFIAGDF
jgi:hypothetical protein